MSFGPGSSLSVVGSTSEAARDSGSLSGSFGTGSGTEWLEAARKPDSSPAPQDDRSRGLLACSKLAKSDLSSPLFHKDYLDIVNHAQASFEKGENEKGFAQLSYVSYLKRVEAVYQSFGEAKDSNLAFLSEESGLMHEYLSRCLSPGGEDPAALARLKPAVDLMTGALELLAGLPDHGDEFNSARCLIKEALKGLNTIDPSLPDDKLQNRLAFAATRLRGARESAEAANLGYTVSHGKFDSSLNTFFDSYSRNVSSAVDALNRGDLKAADAAFNRADLMQEPLSKAASLAESIKSTPDGASRDALKAAYDHLIKSAPLFQSVFSAQNSSDFDKAWKELFSHLEEGDRLVKEAGAVDLRTRFKAVSEDPALEQLRGSKAYACLTAYMRDIQSGDEKTSAAAKANELNARGILGLFEAIAHETCPGARSACQHALDAYAEGDTAGGNLFYMQGTQLSSAASLKLDTEALKNADSKDAWDGYAGRKQMLDTYAGMYGQYTKHVALAQDALDRGDRDAAAAELKLSESTRSQLAGMNRCLSVLPSVKGSKDVTSVDTAFWQFSQGRSIEALATLGSARCDIAIDTFADFLADTSPIALSDGTLRTRESITEDAKERAVRARKNFDEAQTYVHGSHKSKAIAQFYIERAEKELGMVEGTSRACSILGGFADAYAGLKDAQTTLEKSWGEGRGSDVMENIDALRITAKRQHTTLVAAADAFNSNNAQQGTALLAKTDPVLISRVALAGSAARGLVARDQLIASSSQNAEAAGKNRYLRETDKKFDRQDAAFMVERFESVQTSAEKAGEQFKGVICACADFKGGKNPSEAVRAIRNDLATPWESLSEAQRNNRAYMYGLQVMETEAYVALDAEKIRSENSRMFRFSDTGAMFLLKDGKDVPCDENFLRLVARDMGASNDAVEKAQHDVLAHMDMVKKAGSGIRVPESRDGKIPEFSISESAGYGSLKTAYSLNQGVKEFREHATAVTAGMDNIQAMYDSIKHDDILGWDTQGRRSRMDLTLGKTFIDSAFRDHAREVNDGLDALRRSTSLRSVVENYNKLVPDAQRLQSEYRPVRRECAAALDVFDRARSLADSSSPAARDSAKKAMVHAVNFENTDFDRDIAIAARQVEQIASAKAGIDPELNLSGYTRYVRSVAEGKAAPSAAVNIDQMFESAMAGRRDAFFNRDLAASNHTARGGFRNTFALVQSAIESERDAELSSIYRNTAFESGQLIAIGASFVPVPIVALAGRAALIGFSTYSILQSERNMVMNGGVDYDNMRTMGVNLALAGLLSSFRLPSAPGTSLVSPLSSLASAGADLGETTSTGMQALQLGLSGVVGYDMAGNVAQRLRDGNVDTRFYVDLGLLLLSAGHFAKGTANLAGFDARVVRGEASIDVGNFEGKLHVGALEVKTPFTGDEWIRVGAGGVYSGSPGSAAAFQLRGGSMYVLDGTKATPPSDSSPSIAVAPAGAGGLIAALGLPSPVKAPAGGSGSGGTTPLAAAVSNTPSSAGTSVAGLSEHDGPEIGSEEWQEAMSKFYDELAEAEDAASDPIIYRGEEGYHELMGYLRNLARSSPDGGDSIVAELDKWDRQIAALPDAQRACLLDSGSFLPGLSRALHDMEMLGEAGFFLVVSSDLDRALADDLETFQFARKIPGTNLTVIKAPSMLDRDYELALRTVSEACDLLKRTNPALYDQMTKEVHLVTLTEKTKENPYGTARIDSPGRVSLAWPGTVPQVAGVFVHEAGHHKWHSRGPTLAMEGREAVPPEHQNKLSKTHTIDRYADELYNYISTLEFLADTATDPATAAYRDDAISFAVLNIRHARILLSSLDAVRGQMTERGQRILDGFHRRVERLSVEIGGVKTRSPIAPAAYYQDIPKGIEERRKQELLDAVARNDCAETRIDLGDWYMDSAPEKAAENFRAALIMDPDNYQAQYLLANALLNSGDYASAIEAYNKILEIQPDPDAYYLRGMCYQEWGHYDEAVDSFKQAISSSYDDEMTADAYRHLAEIYDAQGKPDDAAAMRKEAARVEAESAARPPEEPEAASAGQVETYVDPFRSGTDIELMKQINENCEKASQNASLDFGERRVGKLKDGSVIIAGQKVEGGVTVFYLNEADFTRLAQQKGVPGFGTSGDQKGGDAALSVTAFKLPGGKESRPAIIVKVPYTGSTPLFVENGSGYVPNDRITMTGLDAALFDAARGHETAHVEGKSEFQAYRASFDLLEKSGVLKAPVTDQQIMQFIRTKFAGNREEIVRSEHDYLAAQVAQNKGPSPEEQKDAILKKNNGGSPARTARGRLELRGTGTEREIEEEFLKLMPQADADELRAAIEKGEVNLDVAMRQNNQYVHAQIVFTGSHGTRWTLRWHTEIPPVGNPDWAKAALGEYRNGNQTHAPVLRIEKEQIINGERVRYELVDPSAEGPDELRIILKEGRTIPGLMFEDDGTEHGKLWVRVSDDPASRYSPLAEMPAVYRDMIIRGTHIVYWPEVMVRRFAEGEMK